MSAGSVVSYVAVLLSNTNISIPLLKKQGNIILQVLPSFVADVTTKRPADFGLQVKWLKREGTPLHSKSGILAMPLI